MKKPVTKSIKNLESCVFGEPIVTATCEGRRARPVVLSPNGSGRTTALTQGIRCFRRARGIFLRGLSQMRLARCQIGGHGFFAGSGGTGASDYRRLLALDFRFCAKRGCFRARWFENEGQRFIDEWVDLRIEKPGPLGHTQGSNPPSDRSRRRPVFCPARGNQEIE